MTSQEFVVVGKPPYADAFSSLLAMVLLNLIPLQVVDFLLNYVFISLF